MILPDWPSAIVCKRNVFYPTRMTFRERIPSASIGSVAGGMAAPNAMGMVVAPTNPPGCWEYGNPGTGMAFGIAGVSTAGGMTDMDGATGIC